MRILALETVTNAGSLALWDDQTCRSLVGDASRRHGERLPTEIVSWLDELGTSLQDIDLLAVVTGPGSFTGLRVGIATVQGIALARQRRTLGISSLDALVAARQATSGEGGLIAPCIDGLRGEIFYSLIDTSAGRGAFEGWRRLIEPAASTPEVAAARIIDVAAGKPVTVLGPGAERHAEVFRSTSTNLSIAPLDTGTTIATGAAWLASVQSARAGSPHALQPIYLRRPDAELARPGPHPLDENGRGLSWRLRRATSPSDLHAVETLQADSFASPWGAEAFRWELEHTDVARLYVLVEPDDRVFAYCACWVVLDELHINSLAVDAARRRQGAGSFLLKSVMSEAAAAGARAATLEVRASNAAAIRMYESQGFHVEATRRDYYQDPREDALVLWKRALE